MTKSSSEILNELFQTFNTSFDETEAMCSLKSSKKKKKHSKKKKEKEQEEEESRSTKRKSSSKEKSITKSRSSTSPKRKSKSNKKLATRKTDEITSPPTSPVVKSTYKSTKLVLDIEEGEILEGVNATDNSPVPSTSRKSKSERCKAPPRSPEHEALSPGKYKRRNRSHSEVEEVFNINDVFLSHIESSPKSRYPGYCAEDDQFSSDRAMKSKSRSNRHLQAEESSSREMNYRSRSSRRSNENRDESRNRTESPVSRRTTSGIVWCVPDRRRDSETLDKTLYFNETPRNDRARSTSRNRYNSASYGGRRRDSSSSRYNRDDRIRRRDRSRSRSYSRSRSHRNRHPDDIIDKAKLLEIARHNASKLMKNGVLPSDIFSRDQIIAIRAGGKSVDELTSYCQRLAKREALGIEDMSSDSGGEGHSDFIHHPFVVKDRPMPSITMNIRNAIPLPVRSAQELAIENAKLKVQFPVSSGTQHRLELEWKPVEEDGATQEGCQSLIPLNSVPVPVGTVAPMPQVPVKIIPLPTPTTPLTIMPTPDPAKPSSSGIKHDPPSLPNLDIGAIISVRLRAMRKLQQNPADADAIQQLEEATQEMKTWAETKALEPKFLSVAEITGGPQAWARKDQLKTATAVSGGMGMHLLQRMGWKPGEGLGKNKEGGTEPLALDVKMDKKGLTATTEMKSKERPPTLPMIYDLSGKHPVSALMELCVKRKWGPPNFDLCFEHGPPHKKQFVYKVVVNGVEYQPCVATNNKKLAKSNSAAFCLQSLGLLPTAEAPASAETLRTVPDYPPQSMGSMGPPAPQPGSSYFGSVQTMRKFIPPLPQASSHTLQTVRPEPQPVPAPLPVPPP